MAIERLWIDANGSNPHAIRRASEWMASELKTGQVGLLVVPTKAGLTGVFAKEQPTMARALEHHGKTSGGGATIALMTERVGPELEPNGPALVLHANMNLLNQVDAIPGVTKVLAVPWLRSDIELWLNLWAPRKIPIPPT